MAVGTGRMAVVLPHGALFRMGKEGEIREKILQMDLLEAVIGLGPNLFYGTGLAAKHFLHFYATRGQGDTIIANTKSVASFGRTSRFV